MTTPSKHILLVEDDLNFGLILFDRLKDSGFKPHWAKNGKEGLKVYNENEVDICLIDVMMPEKDGFSLVEDIRKLDRDTPILMLTAKSLIEDKVKGFKAGADDYLTKPFDFQELLLRMESLLKRSRSSDQEPVADFITIGKYQFYPDKLLLTINGETTKLTKRESETLLVLVRHLNHVIEREVILNMVWGNDNYFNGRSLDVFISRLRKYLNKDTAVEIQNIHGKGFLLKA
ncbi:MAG: response regulator transcription factor [Bacteroidota bacterium]